MMTMSYFEDIECKVFSQEYGQDWLNINKSKCNSFFPETLNFATPDSAFFTLLIISSMGSGIIMMIHGYRQAQTISFLRFLTIGIIFAISFMMLGELAFAGYIGLADYFAKCPSNADELGFDCSFIMKNYNRMVLQYSIELGMVILGLVSAGLYFMKICNIIRTISKNN